MLHDAAYAEAVAPGGRAEPGRFAGEERLVHRRTNALRGPGGRWQLPWPTALGTPWWGARHELEAGAAEPGPSYRTSLVRLSARRRADALLGLHESIGPGRPGVLFVGSRVLPRHVVLVVGATTEIGGETVERGLTIYEPSAGQVLSLPLAAFLDRATRIGGWPVTWVALLPGRRTGAA